MIRLATRPGNGALGYVPKGTINGQIPSSGALPFVGRRGPATFHPGAEAAENIREAIEGYLKSLRKHGDPLPPSIVEEVIEVAGG
jgi:hypothetical protein